MTKLFSLSKLLACHPFRATPFAGIWKRWSSPHWSAGEAHGFEVWRRLEEAGAGALRLREGSLYPALYRLEKAGLIRSAWEEGTAARRGPRRRVYQLTRKGTRRLAEGRAEWQQFVQVIGAHRGGTGMRELMVLVERAVRPVPVGPRQKLRMREELLAHLTEVYEEERARLGDDRVALARRRGGSATRPS